MYDELTKLYKMNYYKANREKRIEYQRTYYKANRDIIMNYKQTYNAEYRLKVKKEPLKQEPLKQESLKKKKEPTVTKVQQKTANIEKTLADLLIKKELFKAKLAAHQEQP